MKITALLLAACALSSCAGSHAEIREPYEKLKLGVAFACTVVNPDALDPEAREMFIRGCLVAADAIEQIDPLIGVEGDAGAPPDSGASVRLDVH